MKEGIERERERNKSDNNIKEELNEYYIIVSTLYTKHYSQIPVMNKNMIKPIIQRFFLMAGSRSQL